MAKRAPLDLGGFILRARALNLYREALRTVRQAPPHAQAELRAAVRQAMDTGRDAQSKDQIKFFLSEGKLRLKELSEMLGLAVVPPPPPPAAAAGAGAGAAARAAAAAAAAGRAAKPGGSCGTPGHKH